MIEIIASISLLVTIIGVPTIYYKLGIVEQRLNNLESIVNKKVRR
jgi:hypothetical protein